MTDNRVNVNFAQEPDLSGYLRLAAEVEEWFGPMVGVPEFENAVAAHIRAGRALLATARGAGTEGAGPTTQDAENPLGGLLFGTEEGIHHVHWLVVSERARGTGVGRRLLAEALDRYVLDEAPVEVVTFDLGHPGADSARVFYERLGFTAGPAAPPGPEGGPRRRYRLAPPRLAPSRRR